jgi:hypothetical protein
VESNGGQRRSPKWEAAVVPRFFHQMHIAWWYQQLSCIDMIPMPMRCQQIPEYDFEHLIGSSLRDFLRGW